MEDHSLAAYLYRSANDLRERAAIIALIESKITVQQRVSRDDLKALFTHLDGMARSQAHVLVMLGAYLEGDEGACKPTKKPGLRSYLRSAWYWLTN